MNLPMPSLMRLAMKLVPGAGVQSMRPVRVTTAGASPVLPLRMVAAGTGAFVGITLWIVADGRYETQSFPSFRITDEELVWDWTTSQSNYRALRAQKTAAASGHIFEVESSAVENENNIESAVQYGSSGGYRYADGGSEYPPLPGVDGGAGETSDQARQADMTTLFTGIHGPSFRLTRLRADLTHASLASDLVLQASADQSVLSNVRHPLGTSGLPQCPVYQGCDVVGYGPRPNDSAPNPNGDDMKTKESFSCATATQSMGVGAPIAFAGILALFGFGAMRQKRRRS